MYTRKTTVINKTGLHARPASDFVGAAAKFKSRINIKNLTEDEGPMNAKSIICILSMGMGPGTEVELSAQGDDEKEAVDTLIALIDSGFGE